MKGDAHRSRKRLSPASLLLGYKRENRIELGQGVFQVLQGEAKDVGYCMQGRPRCGVVDQERLLDNGEMLGGNPTNNHPIECIKFGGDT